MDSRIGDPGLPSNPLEVPRPVLPNPLDNLEVRLVERRSHTVDLIEVFGDDRSWQV